MLRLLWAARERWAAFDGWAASSLNGGDPLTLPPDRFFNLIYHWIVRDGEPDEVRKFDQRLWVPPKGAVPPKGSPWSAEAETAAFRSFASAFKATTGPTPTPAVTGREGKPIPSAP